MFLDMKLEDFVDLVASDAPVPGGGSVSALIAGISAALLEMVSNLTIGRKKYEEYEEDVIKLRSEFIELRAKLLRLMEEDASSYELVMKAYGLPKSTDEEKIERNNAIQEGLYGAALIPLEVAKTAMQGLERVEEMLVKGNKNAYSDVKVAGVMLRSALYGACYNVQINIEGIKNQDRVEELKNAINELRQRADFLEKRFIDLEVN
ncbi:MAG: cyclodeaminase/cyclohydrolase family protein [Tissierellia bacterium]|nr:cyclodeaminase/cyclohydrolase family protein [Tissierellia bacterium]